jgi:toxin ParE1/3/4
VTVVLRSPAAELDLQDIWLEIAADNPPAATRIVRAIGTKILRLAELPRLGPRRSDIRPSARMLVEGPWFSMKRTPIPTRGLSMRSRSSASWTVAAI